MRFIASSRSKSIPERIEIACCSLTGLIRRMTSIGVWFGSSVSCSWA